jgi:hypothetical protein
MTALAPPRGPVPPARLPIARWWAEPDPAYVSIEPVTRWEEVNQWGHTVALRVNHRLSAELTRRFPDASYPPGFPAISLTT